ncbi:MAG: hypothetical protein CM1200mP14_05220 [Gammaproteobacteria bacterium]|nr:MAG: hypothetical protein CM1200mP14_05220 [Gammaproteobacteria bacterium]
MDVSRPRRLHLLPLLVILGFTLGSLEVPAWMVGSRSLVGALKVSAQKVPNARALGIPLQGEPGLNNAITDVVGVEVGHTTIIEGQGPLIVGEGPIRTGVTAILPAWSPVRRFDFCGLVQSEWQW